MESLLAFIVAIGILVTFHEYGHFVVAKYFGVKILRFSIGFGKPLYQRRFGADNTEFVIAAVPLGGYVKMLDEHDGVVEAKEQARSFSQQSLPKRCLIVLAGPCFNFIFALFAYWLVLVSGVTGLKPIIGSVANNSIAAQVGLYGGDEIQSVDDQHTYTWGMFGDVAVKAVVNDAEEIELAVKNTNGIVHKRLLPLTTISIDDLGKKHILEQLGIMPYRLPVPAIIGEVSDSLPAAQAGFLPGDRIISTDGVLITDWAHWVRLVQASAGQRMQVEIQRTGKLLSMSLVPMQRVADNGQQIGFVGVAAQLPSLPKQYMGSERYPPHTAFIKAIYKTYDMSWLSVRLLGKIITGQASYKNMSGPIGIATYAGNAAKDGLVSFVFFLALVSVSLGVLNLLPIPLLDGGHLLYYLIEWVKGSPVSESVQYVWQQIGFCMLAFVMLLVIYNDIARLFLN